MGDTELYDTLGVTRSATDTEIRKEYHKLARQYHPDKNTGNEDKFKDVQAAYEILSDPQKREMYDRYGMAAVKGDDGSSDNPFGGLFSNIFGGGRMGGMAEMFGMGGGRRRKMKAETIGIPLDVSLEEVFNGATKEIEYKRKVLCKTCHGMGGRNGGVSKCKNCRGSGIQVSHRQIGPGMLQQIQSMCSDCGGSGDYFKEKDKCKKCKGKRLIEVDHKQEVPVSMGMSHEEKITFRGMADEMHDGEPGDVIVILQLADHTDFRRESLDLFIDKHITLQEALCGFAFKVTHLDGRKLLLSCPPGHVISPGSVFGVRNEGMPLFKQPDIRGNLYVKFAVEFPKSNFLDENSLKQLENLLPAKPDEDFIDAHAEEVDMIEADTTKGFESGSRKDPYNVDDSDDEEGGMGGQRVGCSQQ